MQPPIGSDDTDVVDQLAADLAPGVQLADNQAFFSLAKGRIVSLDY